MKTTLDCVPQMFRPAILYPLTRPGPLKPGFSRDQKIGGIWMERFCDETFGNYGPVGVGSVDEIDSQLHSATQDRDGLGMIGRFSPDAIAGKLHCTEPDSANGNIAADCEGAAFGRRLRIGLVGAGVHNIMYTVDDFEAIGLLSRFTWDFLRRGRDFRLLARPFVRRPESCPARFRFVSLRRTEPPAADDEKHCGDCKRDPFHSNKVGSI